jgi:SOS-response transcriptional repressor LexA
MEMPPTFAEILEAADKLSLDEQAELIEVLRHRVAERRRDVLGEDIQQARREFEAGQCQPTSPEKILEDLLSEWAEEAERRAQAMEDGSEPEIPAEEVSSRVRASLG